eukprot:TRINITY_DN6119_c0_g1_i3.p1 TRINITY_DN6119_c0_g1~~TRINITY_DN6119_c0_g1_i3.p1  ORF type:complete len:195 (+),score=45.20 TRINITY_DN6119_c0_g1_i3:61-645(+)
METLWENCLLNSRERAKSSNSSSSSSSSTSSASFGKWRVKPCVAPCSQPCACCSSCFCPCCTVYRQRLEILRLASAESYVCFGGRFAEWGCCLVGRCGRCLPILERPINNWRSALFFEAFLCYPLAVVGNRFLLQEEFQRGSDEWDDCICCCFDVLQMVQHEDELEVIKQQQMEQRLETPPPATAAMAGYGTNA